MAKSPNSSGGNKSGNSGGGKSTIPQNPKTGDVKPGGGQKGINEGRIIPPSPKSPNSKKG